MGFKDTLLPPVNLGLVCDAFDGCFLGKTNFSQFCKQQHLFSCRPDKSVIVLLPKGQKICYENRDKNFPQIKLKLSSKLDKAPALN